MSYHAEQVAPPLSVVESSFTQGVAVGAGVVVGEGEGRGVVGAGVSVVGPEVTLHSGSGPGQSGHVHGPARSDA